MFFFFRERNSRSRRLNEEYDTVAYLTNTYSRLFGKITSELWNLIDLLATNQIGEMYMIGVIYYFSIPFFFLVVKYFSIALKGSIL